VRRADGVARAIEKPENVLVIVSPRALKAFGLREKMYAP
jgi:hypothetical protein